MQQQFFPIERRKQLSANVLVKKALTEEMVFIIYKTEL